MIAYVAFRLVIGRGASGGHHTAATVRTWFSMISAELANVGHRGHPEH